MDGALLVVASSSIIVLATEWLWEHPLEEPAEPIAMNRATPAAADAREETKRWLEHYTIIGQQPLFTLDRLPFQPPEEPSIEPQEAPAPSRRAEFRLSAVVTTPAARLALLGVNDDPELKRLSVGEHVAGWTLVEVTTGAVRLQNGAEEIEVRLYREEGAVGESQDAQRRIPARAPRTGPPLEQGS